MKVYLDSNLLVARSLIQHVHHARAIELFVEIVSKRWTPIISTHGLAEIYAILTSAPYKARMTCAEAWQLIETNILPRMEIEPLGKDDYSEVIKECASQGHIGGRIYDAIHIHAARKAECARIYTFNVQHFRQIAPDLLDRIMAP